MVRGIARAGLFLGTVLFSAGAWGKTGASYLDLNLKQNRYLGEAQHSAQTSNYTFISGQLNLEKQTEREFAALYFHILLHILLRCSLSPIN